MDNAHWPHNDVQCTDFFLYSKLYFSFIVSWVLDHELMIMMKAAYFKIISWQMIPHSNASNFFPLSYWFHEMMTKMRKIKNRPPHQSQLHICGIFHTGRAFNLLFFSIYSLHFAQANRRTAKINYYLNICGYRIRIRCSLNLKKNY